MASSKLNGCSEISLAFGVSLPTEKSYIDMRVAVSQPLPFLWWHRSLSRTHRASSMSILLQQQQQKSECLLGKPGECDVDDG